MSKRYLVRRLIQIPFTILGILTIIFFLMRLSGDPATLFASQNASVEDLAAIRERMGFNDPLIVQYGRFLLDILRGDFGNSLRYDQSAFWLIARRIPATLKLAFASLLFSVLIGVPVGVVSALKRDSFIDKLSMLFVLIGQGAPVFWIGIMFIMIFSLQLKWFPASGDGSFKHIILPSFTLGLFFAARIARFTRSSIIEVKHEHYIRTAQYKGLTPKGVFYKHIAKNAAIPVITIIGLSLPSLIGGAVMVESIFAWPGFAGFIVTAVSNRDYPVVQSGVLFMAIFVAIINLLVDVIYCLLDPRITYD